MASFTELDRVQATNTEAKKEKVALMIKVEKLTREVQEKDQQLARQDLLHSTEVQQLKLLSENLKTENELRNSSILRLQDELSDKDATISKKQSEIEEQITALNRKDATISRMNEQLTRTREYLVRQKPLLIGWKVCADLPVSTSNANSTVIDGKVYVGGGNCSQNQKHIVYRYDTAKDKWDTLPTPKIRHFGLGHINGKLVAVGGMKQHIEQQRSKEVYTYYDETQMWDDQTVPPMPTARDSPGVLSVPSALIVAGGDMSQKRQETNAVDVFKTDTSQWHCTTALPTACQIVRLVAIGNRCYALGGVKGSEDFSQALYASVDDLLHNQIHSTHTSTSSTQSTWKTLPNTPNYRPAAAVLAGNLLAIGGRKTSRYKDGTDAKKEIYKYSHCTSSWIHISDLPIPLRTDAAVLSSTEILVIGGWDGEQKRAVVYKGCLSISGHLDQPDTRNSVPSKGVSKKPTLKDLQKEFHTKVADLWEDIGIQLDIDQGLLNKLKADNIGNTGNCLREMFKAWLRKCDPSPAWSAIVEALGALGQEDLAQHIRNEYL